MNALTITKLDVLSGIDPLRVAVRYRSKEGAILDTLPLPPVDPPLGRARVRGAAGLRRRHRRRAAARPTCRRRRAPTSTSSPTSSACRSGSSASAPTASRSIWLGDRARQPTRRLRRISRVPRSTVLVVASGRRTAKLSERLPRGRHGLPREAVTESQRQRILQAMIEVVSERGYPETRVVDVIGVAGVSRKTFYELFASKEDCFLAAYDVLLGNLLGDTARRLRVEARGALGGAGRRRRWRAARAPRRASRRGALRDRRGARRRARRRWPAATRRCASSPASSSRARGDLGRAARDHLALDRRRDQRAALQRDPARRRGPPAEPPARPDVLDHAALPRRRGRRRGARAGAALDAESLSLRLLVSRSFSRSAGLRIGPGW